MKVNKFDPVFVESAPLQLEPGKIYISIKYHTVLHLCPCGCGEEVVTPLAPDQWQLLYDGESISLFPSIGNYRFPCRSHYFIKKNRVLWVGEKSIGTHKKKRGIKAWFSRKTRKRVSFR